MTLADLPPKLLVGVACHYVVTLDARPPSLTLRLLCVPPEQSGMLVELARWRTEFEGASAARIADYLRSKHARWQDLADWLDAYGEAELTGIPGDLRVMVGHVFRFQRERVEADRARLQRRMM